MIDQAYIKIISGKGGNGSVSGRREKFVPAGGPDGGNGGDGGNVYFVCDSNVSTLTGFKYKRRFVAEDGGRGASKLRSGRRGKDTIVSLPVGTEVWDENGGLQRMTDMNVAGQRVMIAKGGEGGRGNARFSSSTNRFPLLAEEGGAGEELDLRLELKLLADVGIFGAPNAGKSSLLAAVSSARPRVAEYPFTTTEAVLGVADRNERSFVMVDIPGLIEGAHTGAGLGHDFLRHVGRSRVLLHVLDGTATDVVNEYRKVRNELARFDERLMEKPEIIAVNKVDVRDVEKNYMMVKPQLERMSKSVHLISAVSRHGLSTLLDALLQELSGVSSINNPTSDNADILPVTRPQQLARNEIVRKDGNIYTVSLPGATRIAAMIDDSNWDARVQMFAHLRRIGVIAALEKSGIKPGDVFRVGEIEWEW